VGVAAGLTGGVWDGVGLGFSLAVGFGAAGFAWLDAGSLDGVGSLDGSGSLAEGA